VVVLLALGLVWEYVLVPRKVVARVNGEPIYVREFQARVKFHRTLIIRRIGSYLLDDPEAMGKQVLDSMIEDVLIRQEMERRGITVTDEEIEKAIQEAFGYYPSGTPTPEPTVTPWATSTLSPTQIALLTPDITPTPTEGPSPTPTTEVQATPTAVPTLALEATPEAPEAPSPTPTPYTEQRFQEDLKAFLKDTGLSMADLRALFRDLLYREKFLEILAEDVPKEEEQVWVRHILVPEEEVAKELLERLQKGESWFQLAQEYSEDRSTAAQGGDLGWIARGDTVKPFEDVAFALEVGEISGVVATPYGWHILQVLGKEVRPLRDDQIQARIQERYESWLAEAKAQADIDPPGALAAHASAAAGDGSAAHAYAGAVKHRMTGERGTMRTTRPPRSPRRPRRPRCPRPRCGSGCPPPGGRAPPVGRCWRKSWTVGPAARG